MKGKAIAHAYLPDYIGKQITYDGCIMGCELAAVKDNKICIWTGSSFVDFNINSFAWYEWIEESNEIDNMIAKATCIIDDLMPMDNLLFIAQNQVRILEIIKDMK